MSFNRAALRLELEADEGNRGRPYDDATGETIRAKGHVTIGIGWNLDAEPLPAELISRMLDLKIDKATLALDVLEPRWRSLDDDRQRVLIGMAFNLGTVGLAAYSRFWRALRAYFDTGATVWLERAADEIIDSKAARDLPLRYGRWAERIRPKFTA